MLNLCASYQSILYETSLHLRHLIDSRFIDKQIIVVNRLRTYNFSFCATDRYFNYVCEMRLRPAFHSHAGALLHDIFRHFPTGTSIRMFRLTPQYVHNNTKLNNAAFLGLELDSLDQDLSSTLSWGLDDIIRTISCCRKFLLPRKTNLPTP